MCRKGNKSILEKNIQIEQLRHVGVDQGYDDRVQRLRALSDLPQQPRVQVELTLVKKRVVLDPLIQKVNAQRRVRVGIARLIERHA